MLLNVLAQPEQNGKIRQSWIFLYAQQSSQGKPGYPQGEAIVHAFGSIKDVTLVMGSYQAFSEIHDMPSHSSGRCFREQKYLHADCTPEALEKKARFSLNTGPCGIRSARQVRAIP